MPPVSAVPVDLAVKVLKKYIAHFANDEFPPWKSEIWKKIASDPELKDKWSISCVRTNVREDRRGILSEARRQCGISVNISSNKKSNVNENCGISEELDEDCEEVYLNEESDSENSDIDKHQHFTVISRDVCNGIHNLEPLKSHHKIESVKKHSLIWKYFSIKDAHNYLATCKGCNNDYSYRTSVGNLNKHWRNKHGDVYADEDADSSEVDEWINNNVCTKNIAKATHKSTWQYFDVLDSDKFAATCRLCSKEVTYENVSDLSQHVKDEHHIVVSEDEEKADGKPKIKAPRNVRKQSSFIWRYMQDIGNRRAICRLCCKKLSFRSSHSNLKKHLRLSHPDVNLDYDEDEDVSLSQHVIITTDGKVYELQSDDEKDPMNGHVEYLESLDGDSLDNFENVSTSPLREYTTYEIPKKRTKTESNKDKYQNNSKNNSFKKVIIKNNTTNSLDIFGQYVASLLSQFPQHISDQLQSEIVKQIFAAKLALNTPNIVSSEQPVTITVNKITGTRMAEISVINDTTQENSDVTTNGK